ncbi:hypothetical protein [Vibrio owensii]|uniref:hypothetical protein n=1 Tax=Vibrio owensii TaxID=696485 RepID=UPI0003825457|nr:hypothetical protein [Vibrio owensii]
MQAYYDSGTNTLELNGRHIQLNSPLFVLARKERLGAMVSSWLANSNLTQGPIEVLVR